MRRYSLTPFFNELDILEIRLAELDPFVDVHVITESDRTFSGRDKPLYIEENWERFSPWHDKIRYLKIQLPGGNKVYKEPAQHLQPSESDAWKRENYQRQALHWGCHDLEDDDVVLLSDLDEIPNAHWLTEEGVEQLGGRHGQFIVPYLPMHVYYLNWRWQEAFPVIARLMTGKTLLEYGPQNARLQRGTNIGKPSDMSLGWHLAYMGGIDAIRDKLRSAAHHELNIPQYTNTDNVMNSMLTGADLFGRQDRKAKWVPDSELPYYVQQTDKFDHLKIENYD